MEIENAHSTHKMMRLRNLEHFLRGIGTAFDGGSYSLFTTLEI